MGLEEAVLQELLLTFQDAIVCLSGFAASLGPQQSVLLSSRIYIDPPPSTASLLPLSILLLLITWEGRLWKWQIRAAAGEAIWQGRKGLSAAEPPAHLVGTIVLSLMLSVSQPLGWWEPGEAQQAGRQGVIVDRDPTAPPQASR